MSLKFGLNVKRFKLNKTKNINVLSSGHDDEDDDEADTLRGKSKPDASKAPSTFEKQVRSKALAEDNEIFDYDAAYDDLKAQALLKKLKNDDGIRPKYMADLIHASKERKIYLEKSKEKRFKRERELHGEMFGETEEFVTPAFFQKQQDAKNADLEQQRVDKLESDPKNKNVLGFYKGILSSIEKERGPVLLGDEEMSKQYKGHFEDKTKDQKIIPAGVKLNDSEDVVDKRDLLVGGLNISSRRSNQIMIENTCIQEVAETKKVKIYESKSRVDAKIENIAAQKRAIEAERHCSKARKEREMVENMTSSTAKGKLLIDAKARFLARKNAAP